MRFRLVHKLEKTMLLTNNFFVEAGGIISYSDEKGYEVPNNAILLLIIVVSSFIL